MYKPDYHEEYFNSIYTQQFKSTIKASGRSFMGNTYVASDPDNYNRLIDEWLNYNAAAICNFKYGENNNVDSITNYICNVIKTHINNNNTGGTIDNKKISIIKDDICKTLGKNAIPVYLIDVCKNLLESNNIIRTVLNMNADIKAANKGKSNYLKLAADGVANFVMETILDKNYNSYDDKINNSTQTINNEYTNLKLIIKQFVSLYMKRRKIVTYVISAHSSTQNGKHSTFLQIFEYKWTRLFGDLLQSALLKMGFTAIKVIPESHEFGYKVVFENGNFKTTRELGSESANMSAMSNDKSVRGERVSIMQKYFNSPPCVVYLTHLNGGSRDKDPNYYIPPIMPKDRNQYHGGMYLVKNLRGINQCDILANHILNTASNEYKLRLAGGNYSTQYGENPNVETETHKPLIGYNYGDCEISAVSDRNPNIPLALTENLYQDVKEDITYLRSGKGIRDILGIHILGMFKYFTERINIKQKYTTSTFASYSTPDGGVNSKTILDGLTIPVDGKTGYESFKYEMESIFDALTITNTHYNELGTTKLNATYNVDKVIASIVGASLVKDGFAVIPSDIKYMPAHINFYAEKRKSYNAIIK